MCLYVLSSVLRCPVRFPHVGSSLPPVVCWRADVSLCFCVCLRIMMSNILLFLVVLVYCVVLCVGVYFSFCLRPVFCVPNGTCFSGLSIIYCPFDYLLTFIFISLYLTLNLNKMVLPYFNACTNLRFTASMHLYIYVILPVRCTS